MDSLPPQGGKQQYQEKRKRSVLHFMAIVYIHQSEPGHPHRASGPPERMMISGPFPLAQREKIPCEESDREDDERAEKIFESSAREAIKEAEIGETVKESRRHCADPFAAAAT
jgi:hypothetical protein